ncbi:MAG: tetratricopeptide repeat protein [Terriglobia bacterium]|jgi:tetratricopeptide (TPR) repeat protein
MRLRKTLTSLIPAMGLAFALSVWGQQKPFTQEQVSNMARAGRGDGSGAKPIGQRGIDIAPAEDFFLGVEAAGASEPFPSALRAARQPESASARKPVNPVQVFSLLAAQVPSRRVAMLIEERGIDFEPSDDYLQEIRLAGGEDDLIRALQSAKVTKPVNVDPVAQEPQAEVQQHVARGAEFLQKSRYADAEVEYRAAVRLDPQSADLHVGLSRALNGQKKTDDALAEAREALSFSPGSDLGHYSLGNALRAKGDWDGAIAEYREALRLNPNYDWARVNRGAALEGKGDWDGAIREEREALRLNPNYDMAHLNLGVALGNKGDLDGAIAECRAALRLNPNLPEAYYNLGIALYQKGDWDGAIAEYHEALRLNPNYVDAHTNLGVALRHKGDLDGAIVEYRAALRLNPNLSEAHNNLGVALERKGDRQGALDEYRAAYTIDPKDATYGRNYQRLLKSLNP